MAEIGVTAITLALWFLLYQRMVPLAIPADLLGIETEGKSLEGEEESSTRRKSKRRRNLEERKPLVEPIQEEEEDGERDEEEDEYGNKLERNNATVGNLV